MTGNDGAQKPKDDERDRRAMEEGRKYVEHMEKVRREKAAQKKRLGLPPDPLWADQR